VINNSNINNSNNGDSNGDSKSHSNGSAARNGQELSNRRQSRRNGNGNVPPPERGPGRPVGSQNRTTRILKEAVLLAAEQTGEDNRGKGGLVGYLRRIARTEPKAFCALLQRILPMQVTAKFDIDSALREPYSSVSEAREKLRALGVPVQRFYAGAEQIEDHSNEDNSQERDDDRG
jgi:hypothetical protein